MLQCTSVAPGMVAEDTMEFLMSDRPDRIESMTEYAKQCEMACAIESERKERYNQELNRLAKEIIENPSELADMIDDMVDERTPEEKDFFHHLSMMEVAIDKYGWPTAKQFFIEAREILYKRARIRAKAEYDIDARIADE